MQVKRLLLATLSGLVTLSLSTSTFAGECWASLGPGGCVSVPWGWYAEGNLGITRLSNASFSGSADGTSWNLDIGYKFMPYFGLEFGYTSYADVNISNAMGQSVANGFDSSIDLAARGILPLGSFEAFSKLGIARIHSHVVLKNSSFSSPVSPGSEDKIGLYLAVGAQYYMSPNLAVHAQWARAKGNGFTGTLDLWTIGASFLFGG